MKINFENVKVYTDITRKSFFEADVKEQLADILYKHGNGIRAHALALKIYNSNGETEFMPAEVAMVLDAAETYCTPNFIDAIKEILNAFTPDEVSMVLEAARPLCSPEFIDSIKESLYFHKETES